MNKNARITRCQFILLLLLSRRGRDYFRPSARTTRYVRVIPFRIPAVIPVIGLFRFTVYCWLIIGVGIARICIGIRIGVTVRIVVEWVIAIRIRVEGKPEVSAKIEVGTSSVITVITVITSSVITSAVITTTAITTTRRTAPGTERFRAEAQKNPGSN
jgi:hypothetical protein